MNYPKMLYKGNKTDYEYATANDADHEDELKDQSFIEYAELKDAPEPVLHSIGESEPNEQLEKLSDDLAEANEEIKRLNQIIDAGAIENAELRAQLEKNQPEMSSEVNHSDMTSDELRVLLDEKGIKYLARDNKDTLLKLLG